MFGRGGEEASALARAGIAFRIVPGTSAGLGGLAYAGIPVTHRDTNHAVIFLTGHDESGELPQSVDWSAVANAAPVIVMFMAVKHVGAIAAKLTIAAGRNPADRLAVVSHAALPGQKVIEATLGEAETLRGLETPAIVVLGPVSGYRPLLDWYGPCGSAICRCSTWTDSRRRGTIGRRRSRNFPRSTSKMQTITT